MNIFDEKYVIIKNLLSKELVKIYNNYAYRCRDVYATLRNYNYINPFNEDYGKFNDGQTEHTFCKYGDMLFDNMLLDLQPKIEKKIGLELSPEYTYFRIYQQMSELTRHKDRGECEISGTINLGGVKWPIYIDPNSKNGKFKNEKYIPGGDEGKKVVLEPGDCMIYLGCECEHWREPLMEDGECSQVFIHYKQKKNIKDNVKFDNRMGLGMPGYTHTDK
jgi:hypothetical protein|tara:strand:+ start:1762 stop:2418 length:657 start_codon:yes stop_codon:yes gene_type:complete